MDHQEAQRAPRTGAERARPPAGGDRAGACPVDGGRQDEEQDGSAAAFEFVRQLAAELSTGSMELPSLPGVVTRIKAVLDNENSTADRVARVVGSEPTFAARLLRIANSAAFSRGGAELTDLKSAVSRVGHEVIRTSAMSLALENMLDARSVARLKPYLKALWQHSIHVAAIAFALGKRAKGVDADTAMFAGLIHDVGKLYILTRLEHHEVLFRCPKALAGIMEEWHSEIGKVIAESWELPDAVVEAVHAHEDSARHRYGPADLVDVIVVANAIANDQTRAKDAPPADYEGISAFARLGIDAANLDAVVEESREEVEALLQALRG